jgi:peptidoglycan hydrolase-like protein with peptidoglycan-binding domain
MPEPSVREHSGEEKTRTRTEPLARRVTPLAGSPTQGAKGPGIETGIKNLDATGRPIPESTRHYFETRFGVDFSQVRLHTDDEAAESARALGARAFATGKHVAFGIGQYSPQTTEGKGLLAHELTHVLQQRGQPGSQALQLQGLTEKQKREDLKSQPYAANRRLQRAFDNDPPLGIGESGEAVRLVQEGLVEDGFAMPGSTKTTGEMDGEFGPETFATVKKFQTKHTLDVDGVVGRQTMGRLDALKKAPSKPAPTGGPPTKVVGHGASADAVRLGRERMNEVIGSLRKPETGKLKGATIELHIIPHDKKLTDLKPFAHLKGKPTHDGRKYDELRGVGGIKKGNTIYYAVAEEQLVSVPGKPSGYARGFVASHETGHLVEQFGMTEGQKKRLTMAYKIRKKSGGPWLNPASYTKANTGEYFAQCTAAYFGRPYSTSEADKKMYTRAWLKKNDKPMYVLLYEIYR